MIYHLLAESEPFSDIKGGAVSRWVANVNRTCGGSVVCSCADETWGFDSERIAILPKFHLLRRVRAKAHRLPIWLQKLIILQILKPLARTIHAGDIVWVHNRPEYASILSRFLAKRRIQVVLHMHNSHLKALDNRAWPLDSVTPVYCSHFLAGEASRCGVSMKAGFVLHNGVDPHLFHPAPMSDCERVEIAFAGRLVPEKGVHILVDAMRILYEEGLNARCTIIGAAGFGSNTASDYVRRLKSTLPPNTAMLGYRSGAQYADRLREASVFCCPSIWEEPFGMVVVEAMASGLPVVASAIGGIPEILKFGGGVLVEPSNSTVLATELKRLILERDLRMRMREQAINVIQAHFTWDLIRQRYTQIADEVATCGDIHKTISSEILVSC